MGLFIKGKIPHESGSFQTKKIASISLKRPKHTRRRTKCDFIPNDAQGLCGHVHPYELPPRFPPGAAIQQRIRIHHNRASRSSAFAESFIQAPVLNYSTTHLILLLPVLKSCGIHWEESANDFNSDLMLSSARKSFVWISLMSTRVREVSGRP